MQQTRTLIFAVFASIGVIATGPHAASAQDASAPRRIPVLRHALSVARERSRNDDDAAGACARGEFQRQLHRSAVASRRGPIHGIIRGSLRATRAFSRTRIHLPVSTKITTHNILFQGGNAALKADTGTGIALYRFLEDPVQFADAGLGFRAWGFSSRVSLNPGLLPGVSVNPRRRLGRSADRWAISPRAWQWLRAHCLWRCRRLWGRRAYRLAGARHGRLYPQPIVEPAPRLPQPQFRYYGKRRQVWLQRPYEGADPCRHVPFLTRRAPGALQARKQIILHPLTQAFARYLSSLCKLIEVRAEVRNWHQA